MGIGEKNRKREIHEGGKVEGNSEEERKKLMKQKINQEKEGQGVQTSERNQWPT